MGEGRRYISPQEAQERKQPGRTPGAPVIVRSMANGHLLRRGQVGVTWERTIDAAEQALH